MGADFYSRALIGVRVPMDKIIKVEKGTRLRSMKSLDAQHCGRHPNKPKCPDFDLLPGMRNCPYCGCSLYESYEDEIILIPDLRLDTNNCGIQSYKEWPILFTTEANYLFIGFYAIDGSHRDDCAYIGVKHTIDTEEIDIKKAQLKSDLEKVGLWDESEFGLWLSMYNSY